MESNTGGALGHNWDFPARLSLNGRFGTRNAEKGRMIASFAISEFSPNEEDNMKKEKRSARRSATALLLVLVSACLYFSGVAVTSDNDASRDSPKGGQEMGPSGEGIRENRSEPTVLAEIVAIGDELCYGKVYDTNSFWMADQITRRGVLVQRIVCVRDNIADISDVLKDGLGRKPRFIFITGGLGHTEDDMTRAALSAVTGRKIVGRPDVLEFIAGNRGVTVDRLPPHFKISTSSLEGATALPNPAGVSPVLIIKEGPTEIIALPGPPREVYACFAAHLAERVQKVTGYYSHSRRIIIDMHESELTPLMTKVMREISGTYVKALVGGYQGGIGMPTEVMAFGPTGEFCRETCDKAVERLRRLATEKGRKVTELPQGDE
jgi:nicotinamide-nucleotide amidase